MARILIAWELGNGYGHIARVLPLAVELQRRGHEPALVLREVTRAETLVTRHGLRVLQAPVYPDRVKGLPAGASFAELLMHAGYLDPQGLAGLARAWRELFALLRPQLLVCDMSPSALLASTGLGVPRAVFGDGYTCPPLATPMPPLGWWLPGPARYLPGAEHEVLRNANTALAAFGLPAAASVAAFLRADEEFLATFEELDHYPARAGARYYGSMPAADEGVDPPWPSGEKRVFGYVRPDFPALDRLLRGISASAHAAVVHVPGMSPAAIAQYPARNLAICPQPVRISAATAQCDAVICHASHGTTVAGLLAGKPLLLAPTQAEQQMLARRGEMLGAGLVVLPGERPPDFKQLLGRVLGEPGFATRASAFAAKYRGHDPRRAVELIADRCERLIAPGG